MANDEIFDLDKTRDRSRLREPDVDALSGGLEALVGRPRMTRVTDDIGHDLPRLVAMVDAAAANRAAMPVDSAPSSVRRSRRRIDWLSAVTGAAAVVAVAVASVFTVVQVANASPAADAVAVLQSDEDTLISAELGLTASRARIEEQIAKGATTAQTFQAAIAVFAPAEDEEPFVDAAVLDAANGAAAQYTATLDAIEMSESLPKWKAPSVDEDSLASVAAAIDEVQERSALVDELTAEVRTTRQSVETATAAFTAGVDSFRASLGASTQAVLDDAPDAQQSLRDALTIAAANATAADLTTPAGAAALQGYRDAVRALREGQTLAAEEAEREREREREQENERRSTNNDESQNDSGTNDPGTGTTDPGTDVPPPTEEPTEPVPVDPVP